VSESVLLPGESSLLRDCAKIKTGKSHEGVSGVLLLTTAERIVFVESRDTFRKQYDINHCFAMDSVINVRTEKKLIGKRLVIDYKCRGKILTYRYEGFSDPQRWMTTIRTIKSEKGRYTRLKYEILGRMMSQEKTEFSEIVTIYGRNNFKTPTDDEIVSILTDFLRMGVIEGIIDREKRRFIHKIMYEGRAIEKNIEKNIILEKKVPFLCFQCGHPLSDEQIFWGGPNKIRCPVCDSILEENYEAIDARNST